MEGPPRLPRLASTRSLYQWVVFTAYRSDSTVPPVGVNAIHTYTSLDARTHELAAADFARVAVMATRTATV